ncbi:MAG: mandelate racemase [Pseudonocardiales bacterium]|nr:MAG: mandelate racemase [Pseudonocardiales bacterium]
MRIVDIWEHSIEISRYRDPAISPGDLTTSLVAIVTDVQRSGRPVIGYGFGSVGRYAQSGLIRERFARRLLAAATADILTDDGANFDPFRAWTVMMAGEKPGGHGERCVAVGTLDMALWDAAAKIADMPLNRLLAQRLGREDPVARVAVYASGGYPYPDRDLPNLVDEIRHFLDLGFTQAKIKIGRVPLHEDLLRVEAAATAVGGSEHLAVDAMNAYDSEAAVVAAAAFEPLRLRWLEDICDPLDFATHARVAERYLPPIAAGEALFSLAEAALLDRHAGLRPQQDILLFDPVHCYGLPGYLRIIDHMAARGWPLSAFWPHGGHLFSLHLVAALGLGAAEITPLAFHPFHGPPTTLPVTAGTIPLPEAPGIGFELHDDAWKAFRSLTTD